MSVNQKLRNVKCKQWKLILLHYSLAPYTWQLSGTASTIPLNGLDEFIAVKAKNDFAEDICKMLHDT